MGPVANSRDLSILHHYAGFGHNMSQKFHTSLEKGALGRFQFQLRAFQPGKDFVETVQFFVKAPPENDDIVQVYRTGEVRQATQDKVHQSLEDARRTCHPERHYGETIASAPGNESRFVLFGDRNIVIP